MIIIPCLYDLSYTYCCVLSISVVEVLLKIPGVVVVVVVNVFVTLYGATQLLYGIL